MLDALLNFSATPKGLFLLHSTGAMNDCVNFMVSSLSKKLQVSITDSALFFSFLNFLFFFHILFHPLSEYSKRNKENNKKINPATILSLSSCTNEFKIQLRAFDFGAALVEVCCMLLIFRMSGICLVFLTFYCRISNDRKNIFSLSLKLSWP